MFLVLKIQFVSPHSHFDFSVIEFILQCMYTMEKLRGFFPKELSLNQ